MTDSFWAGGSNAFLKEIRKRYEPILNELKRRRRNADEMTRRNLDAEIEKIESQYRKEIDETGSSLF